MGSLGDHIAEEGILLYAYGTRCDAFYEGKVREPRNPATPLSQDLLDYGVFEP